MNKKITLLLPLAALILAGCGNDQSSISSSLTSSEETNESSSVAPSEDKSSGEQSSEITSEPSSEPSSESSSEQVADNAITLKMLGNVFVDSVRTIYASLEKEVDSDIIWESSNEQVASVSASDKTTREALVTGKSYGKTTIKAILMSNASVFATYELEIKKGEAMPAELYDNLKGSLKVNSTVAYVSTDDIAKQPNVDSNHEVTTIFEENKTLPNYELVDTTDAYQISIKDENGAMDFERKYVKDNMGFVATESNNMYTNKINADKITNEEGEGTKWANTIYKNLFADDENINNTLFETFDGGQTYHFVGLNPAAVSLAASLYGENINPDDVYFEVNDGSVSLVMMVEPVVSQKNGKLKFGVMCLSTFADKGTATIDHLMPFEHKSYHDTIDAAFDKIVGGQNYTVTYKRDYAGEKDDETYTYTFTENDIHVVSKYYMGNKLESKQYGMHRVNGNDGYNYEVLENGDIVINSYVDDWSSKKYPTFQFASEIFNEVTPNNYETIGNYGRFIQKCLLMKRTAMFDSYDSKGSLGLNLNGDLAYMETMGVDGDNASFTLRAEFANIGTSSVNLDFSKAKDPVAPTGWKEANKDLYDDMVKWKIADVVPYLAAENGFNNFIGQKTDNETNKVLYAYINLERMSSNEVAAQYVKDYQNLLVKEGFVETEEVEANTEAKLYKKGNYMIGITYEKQLSGFPNPVLKPKLDCPQIVVVSPALKNPNAN